MTSLVIGVLPRARAQTATEIANTLAGTNGLTLTEALSRLVYLQSQQTAQEHGAHMPGMFTIVVDDNDDEWIVGDTYTQSCITRGIGMGFTVEMSALGGGTLTLEELLALKAAGFEMGTAGIDESSALYNGDASWIASGYTVAQEDSFRSNIELGVEAQINAGLGQPRFHSYSNSSMCLLTASACQENGIEYAVSSTSPVTGSASYGGQSGQHKRGNVDYFLNILRIGTWDTGGSGGADVSAHRTWHGDPYAIAQTLAESSSYATWVKVLNRAAQTGGLVVLNLHKASVAQTSAGVSWDFLMALVESYIDSGYLISLNPSDAFDHYWKRPLSSVTRIGWGLSRFDDIDGDGHLDGWASDNAGQVASDTAMILPWGTATSGHNGRESYSLNWDGAGITGSTIGNYTHVDPYSGNKAIYVIRAPQGGGRTIKWEWWVGADTTAGGGWAISSGDTVGVTFVAFDDASDDYRWGTSASWTVLGTVNPSSGNNNQNWTSSRQLAGAGNPGGTNGNELLFGSRNSILRASGKEWMYHEAFYNVPEWAEYVGIVLWKTAGIPAGGVVFSDYSVTTRRAP